MKHYTRLPDRNGTIRINRLVDDVGDRVVAYDRYADWLCDKRYAQSTITRYLDSVALFLDYLTETGVFKNPHRAPAQNAIIDSYFRVRLQADRYRSIDCADTDKFTAWAKGIADALDYHSVNHSGNSAAAIRHFIKLIGTVAASEIEEANLLPGSTQMADYATLYAAIASRNGMSSAERKTLTQYSFLACASRTNSNGISVPRGLQPLRHPGGFTDDAYLDFPVLHFLDTVSAATSHRDRAFWLLLGSSGLRSSEATALTWDYIDFERRTVFVADPKKLRFSADNSPHVPERFKGRSVSCTYLIPQFRDLFFTELEMYMKVEYDRSARHKFVFQDIRPGPTHGRPYHNVSDNGRLKPFHQAVERTGVPHPLERIGKRWVLHSLRHMYGVFLLNYIPVPGGYGLHEKEVQRLLGHRTLTATRHYARRSRSILEAKLSFADDSILSVGDSAPEALRTLIANRLRHQADLVELGALRNDQ